MKISTQSFRDGFFTCKELVFYTFKMFEKHATNYNQDEILITIQYILEPKEEITEKSIEESVIDYLEENDRLKNDMNNINR